MYRSFLEADMEKAIVLEQTAEKTQRMASEQMDIQLEEKKGLDRCVRKIILFSFSFSKYFLWLRTTSSHHLFLLQLLTLYQFL